MSQEHFFSEVMVVLPHFLKIFFIVLRRRSYPSSLHLSILWSSPGGEELLVVAVPHQWTTAIILLNNNTEPWTFFQWWWSYPSLFFHSHFLRRRSYPSSFHLSILWSSPGGKDLLVFTGGGGQGVPKNHRTMLGDSFSGTAAGWIVSVGDVGLNAHHFWSNNPWFLLCFSMFFH